LLHDLLAEVERLDGLLARRQSQMLELAAERDTLKAEVERLTAELKRLDDKWYPDTIADLDHLANVMRQRDEARATVAQQADALRFVVNRQNLMFAECSDAEKIIEVCRAALASQPKVPT
jgi:chromosome segregation ATPase